MNRDEFNGVLTYITTCYPNLVQWLESSPGDTVGVWFEVLEDVDAELAKEAVWRIVAGERESVPFSQLPAAVRKGAKELAFALADETVERDYSAPEVFLCEQCKDSGWRAVVSPFNNRAALRRPPENWQEIPHDEWPLPVRICLTICNVAGCRAGEFREQQNWNRRKKPVMFHPERCCEVQPEWNDKERFEALQDFWLNYKLPNRYTEFDAWSGDDGF